MLQMVKVPYLGSYWIRFIESRIDGLREETARVDSSTLASCGKVARRTSWCFQEALV